MRKVLTYILATVFLMGSTLVAYAQGSGADNTFGGVVRLDKIVHDFGDILVTDGPVTATFTATNVGDKPLVIYSVVSSCGCTDVEWTKQPLKPGEKGTIKVPLFHMTSKAVLKTKGHKEVFKDKEKKFARQFRVNAEYIKREQPNSLVSLESSLEVMELMDEIRRQIGVVFPCD